MRMATLGVAAHADAGDRELGHLRAAGDRAAAERVGQLAEQRRRHCSRLRLRHGEAEVGVARRGR